MTRGFRHFLKGVPEGLDSGVIGYNETHTSEVSYQCGSHTMPKRQRQRQREREGRRTEHDLGYPEDSFPLSFRFRTITREFFPWVRTIERFCQVSTEF